MKEHFTMRAAQLRPYTTPRRLAWGAAALLCCTAIALLQPAAPTPEQNVPEAVAQAVDKSALSTADTAHYRAAFDALASNDLKGAEGELFAAHNPILRGHALAQTYLHKNSNPSAEELSLWLKRYGDHPEAYRIALLAKRKGADVTPARYKFSRLQGDGFIDHLGRRTPPAAWYQGLALWRKGGYGTAAAKFESVGEDTRVNSWHRAAGYYWAFRSYARLGEMGKAQAMLLAGRQFANTFYGMLATTRLGAEPSIIASAPYVPSDLNDHPAVLRARALVACGQQELAENELRQLYSYTEEDNRPALLSVASDLGLANLQIRLRKMAGLSYDEQFFAAYPVPADVVASSGKIPPALVLAVAREESAFRSDAGSEAGARGMMQVMPHTAAAVMDSDAFKTSLAYASDDLAALEPHTANMNVKIGASYLEMLRTRPQVNGGLIQTLAAYNAGPGSVAAWQKISKNMADPLLYIESIPYPETRNYVVQVLAHYVVYQQILGDRADLLAQLAQGQWPQMPTQG